MVSKKKKQTVFVGLSGGVDSAVAATLLKKKGCSVTGVYLREYDLAMPSGIRDRVACSQSADRSSAVAVAAALDIPFEEWDFRHVYKKEVVEYLVSGYAAGGTPNPDVMCNKHVKFGAFLEHALKRGADFIATGHYARIQVRGKRLELRGLDLGTSNLSPITYHLRRAKDLNKDQTYFLYTLTQKQLSHSLFPLGNMTKPEVRAYAKKIGLPNWNRKDSQGVCFIGKIAMKDFLASEVGKHPGPLMTRDGARVGAHDGAAYYTMGQRHGLGYRGGDQPYFVVEKDMEKNIVYVAKGDENPELFRKELTCASINWISGIEPTFPLRCSARIRYRQPLQTGTLFHVSRFKFRVEFDRPQRAVTPGQAIVFYRGSQMLGGGVIEN